MGVGGRNPAPLPNKVEDMSGNDGHAAQYQEGRRHRMRTMVFTETPVGERNGEDPQNEE